jgi:glycerol-3-phosphate dehydrogenase
VDNIAAQPRPLQQEVDYLLEHAGRYLSRRPEHSDILAMYAGLRPLVRAAGSSRSSASLSREHEILISSSGLLSVIGGKWTTYRHMGEQLVNTAEDIGRLRKRPSRTADLRLRGAPPVRRQNSDAGSSESAPAASVYGTDYETIQSLVQLDATRGERLHPALPYTVAEVIWAAEQEMARTPEDVLARRTRALLLDTAAAAASAETVTGILAKVLRRDQAWSDAQLQQFNEIREQYAPLPADRMYSPSSHQK